MIDIVNEAINRKLNSISFTTVIKGVVESLEPLKVRISNKIVIGLDFIEPRSLGIDDSSPSSALPLVVGEEIDMIRYNNGQRFYILGKLGVAETVLEDILVPPRLLIEFSNGYLVEEIDDKDYKINEETGYVECITIPVLNNDIFQLNEEGKLEVILSE